MGTRFFTSGTAVTLTLVLDDGATSLFPRAKVFSGGSFVQDVDLSHVSQGLYSSSWVPGASVAYDILFIVYSDAGRTTEAPGYTRDLERWQSDAVIADATWDEDLSTHTDPGSAGEFLNRLDASTAGNIADTNTRMRLVEKILRNRLELADGTTGNWVLYDDDNTTPLLTWGVSDKDGASIVQPKLVPSRRTRGV